MNRPPAAVEPLKPHCGGCGRPLAIPDAEWNTVRFMPHVSQMVDVEIDVICGCGRVSAAMFWRTQGRPHAG